MRTTENYKNIFNRTKSIACAFVHFEVLLFGY